MNEFFRRLHYLLHRRQLERELANDMEFHREMAAHEGRNNFGNDLQLREEARDAWGWTWIDRLGQDLHYAVRVLAKSPGFTLAAVVMLAIGIGVNIAAFGFFDLVVLRPLDVRDPATLVRFHRQSPDHYAFALPYPEMAFFRENTRTLSSVIAINTSRLPIRDEEKQSEIHFVSANYFRELGATPRFGRMLDPSTEDSPSAAPVVVLSEGFWERHFGGDPSIVGKTMFLNSKPVTIIGVAAKTFGGLSVNVPAAWAPLAQQPRIVEGSPLFTDWSMESPGVQMFGRVQAGQTPKAAETELSQLAAELHRQRPEDVWEKEALLSEPGGYMTGLMNGGRRGTGAPGGNEQTRVFLLVGVFSLLILVVTCANLGGLLMARGVAREREMSIRSAIGAGTTRLVRQLLTESVLLAALGAGAGLLLGDAVLKVLISVSGAPPWLDASPDWRVSVFAAGMAFLAVALFGLVPAFQTARRKQRSGSRQFLVAAQVATSCVLVILATLLGRAANHVVSTGPGYEYQHVISISPGLDRHGYTPARARTWLETAQARIAGIPGVESVSTSATPPLGGASVGVGFTIDNRVVNVELHRVDPEFFRTIELPIVRGRNLWPREPNAVLVSESLARTMWPGADPVGQKIELAKDYTVVGVVRSARLTQLQNSDSVEAYVAVQDDDLPSVSLLVRTSQPPENLARTIQSTVAEISADTYPEMQLLSVLFDRKMKAAQYTALTVSVLGGVANLLACLGILGVVAYTVSQRTREIALRIAIGGRPRHVLSTVLRGLLTPVSAGLVVGVAGAIGLSRYLRQILYGISSLDTASYAIAIGLFLVTVAAAAILPARKALAIDPMRALREV